MELKLISDMHRKDPHAGLVVFWVKLQQRGYSRSISGLYRVLRRSGQEGKKLPNPKYTPKKYEDMRYPEERVQIDVKFVPQSCLVGDAAIDGGYYQYTFIDEYSRFRYLEAFQEHSTYSSTQFLRHVVKKFPYAIECVQTDNGSEFTDQMNANGTKKPTLFEKELAKLGIRHKFYSFDDFKKQLAVWERSYNNFPMRPLNWNSPRAALLTFSQGVTHH